MRIGIAAAVASALLFAASHAAEAAPLVNLKDGARAPAGMVDLVRKGGGGGGGKGGFSRGGRGFSGKGISGRSFSGKSFKGGRSYSGRGYAGRSFKGYKGRSFKGYSGRSYKGGRYAYGGKGYGKRYSHKGRYYRRYGYPFFWGGIGIAGAYGSNCGWLYRQAQATGSAYWWQRYEDCVYYY